MVEETEFEGSTSFRCEVCDLHYEERATAEQCETYCREHDACNSEIVQESLEMQ